MLLPNLNLVFQLVYAGLAKRGDLERFRVAFGFDKTPKFAMCIVGHMVGTGSDV